jgi:hypothetical protein
MSKQLSSLVVVLATAFGVLGPSGTARADAVTVGTASQVPGTKKVEGTGTFSVSPGQTLVAVTMVVSTLGGKVVDSPTATVPPGTTEWNATSKNPLPPGTYLITATIETVDAKGNTKVTGSQNTIQVTVR